MKIEIELQEFHGSKKINKYLKIKPLLTDEKKISLEIYEIIENEHVSLGYVELFIDGLMIALRKINL